MSGPDPDRRTTKFKIGSVFNDITSSLLNRDDSPLFSDDHFLLTIPPVMSSMNAQTYQGCLREFNISGVFFPKFILLLKGVEGA